MQSDGSRAGVKQEARRWKHSLATLLGTTCEDQEPSQACFDVLMLKEML